MQRRRLFQQFAAALGRTTPAFQGGGDPRAAAALGVIWTVADNALADPPTTAGEQRLADALRTIRDIAEPLTTRLP